MSEGQKRVIDAILVICSASLLMFGGAAIVLGGVPYGFILAVLGIGLAVWAIGTLRSERLRLLKTDDGFLVCLLTIMVLFSFVLTPLMTFVQQLGVAISIGVLSGFYVRGKRIWKGFLFLAVLFGSVSIAVFPYRATYWIADHKRVGERVLVPLVLNQGWQDLTAYDFSVDNFSAIPVASLYWIYLRWGFRDGVSLRWRDVSLGAHLTNGKLDCYPRDYDVFYLQNELPSTFCIEIFVVYVNSTPPLENIGLSYILNGYVIYGSSFHDIFSILTPVFASLAITQKLIEREEEKEDDYGMFVDEWQNPP